MREDVINIPELRINPLSDRIVHAMFTDNPGVQDLDRLMFQVRAERENSQREQLTL